MSIAVVRPSSAWSRRGGGGDCRKSEEQPLATQITHAPEPPVWSADAARAPVPIAAMPNGRCRMHGGQSPGAPRKNKNALKHGRFTAAAIARRRGISTFIRAMRALANEAG
jgi:hypothetical protein